ncbi:MAG: ADOP family duplicated permease [Acidobacteriota bacterium]
MLRTLTQDLKHTFRNLARRPVFTAVVILSLTLGILPVMIIGSLINAVLLRPPRHVRSPERLAAVFVTGDPSLGNQYSGLLYPDVIEVRKVSAFEDVAAYSLSEITLRENGVTRALQGIAVSENYFDLLGAHAAAGRAFAQRETTEAVLGYALWQRRFNRDPGIIGKEIDLDGKLMTVIGVAPQGLLALSLPFEPDVYVPLADDPVDRRASRRLAVMARLRAGATIEEAQGQLASLQAGLRDEHPQHWGGEGRDLKFAVFRESETRLPLEHRMESIIALGLLSFLGLLVLAIACSNLAALLLARGSERGKEIAIRLAMGAGRGRIVRLLLTESLTLVSVAGLAGLLLVYWIAEAIASGHLLTGMENIAIDFTLDIRVTVFAFVVCLATGILFGLAPALRASRTDVISSLKGEPEFVGSRRVSLRNAFVIIQVAASVILLATAGLFLRSFQQAAKTDPGFDPTGVVAVEIGLPRESYSTAESRRFFDEMEARLRANREVTMSFTMWNPFSGRSLYTGIKSADASAEGGFINAVGPQYFEMMKMPLLVGRNFNEADSGRRVAIINHRMARSLWPDEDASSALGRHITPARTGEAVEVIGVVSDAKYTYLAEPGFNHLWIPFSSEALVKVETKEESAISHRAALLARSEGDANSLISAIRQLAFQADSRAIVREPRMLSDLVAERGTSDFAVGLKAALGAGLFALILAGVGVYGVLSFTVSRRAKEIGIRMALGASSAKVIREVLSQGIRFTAVGLAAGLIVSIGVAQFLSALFEGMAGIDGLSLGLSALSLLATAIAASAVPALRASRIDPMEALRRE